MKLSISPTLLNSFDWYKRAPENWKGKAFDEIRDTIRRERKGMPVSAQRGVDFEELVYYHCDNVPPENVNGSEHFREVVEHCRGGQYQTWTSYYFDFEGNEVRAYGKIDCLLPDKVIDIKTTQKFKGVSQYINGWQPAVYLLGTEKPVFEFVVAEWATPDPDDRTIKKIHYVEVPYGNNLEERLIGKYGEFVDWLKTVNLYDDYVYTFCKNYR